MDKIPFEDGTLVTAGYVEIDGTQYETVQPEYTGTTPLSAYNLNKMQDNIESDINAKAEEQNTLREDGDLVRKIKISGASKQETREGYNLVDFSIGGALVNDILTISGDTAYKSYTYNITNVYKNNPNKTLYFSYESIDLSNANIGMVQLIINKTDGTTTYNSLMDRNGKLVPYTIPSDTSDISKVTLGVYANNSSTSGITYTIVITKPMLAFEENLPYEQYGASPSIEYEAPIESVGDNINLFDKNDTSKILSSGVDGNTLKVTSNNAQRLFYIECEPNMNYTISKLASTRLQFWDSIEKPMVGVTLNSVLNTDYNFTGTKKTVKTSTNAKYLVCYYYYSSSDTLSEEEIRNSIKICKSTSTGAYSPYGQGSITVVNSNKNFINIKDGSWTENGLTINVKENVININGTVTSSSNVFFTLKETLSLNGNYSFQAGNDIALTGGEYFRLYTGTTGFEVLKAFGALTSLNTKSENINITGKADRLAIRVNAGTVFNNVTFKLQLEQGSTATEYVEHQSQTKALYTQQPFRAIGDVKDRFVKQNGVCHEKHNIIRKILNGTENWVIQLTNDNVITFRNDGTQFNGIIPAQEDMSNMFANDLTSGGLSKANCFRIANHDNRPKIFFCLPLSSGITTVELWKTKLAELYNAGTPVYVDCQLETPTLIPCTPEQVEVLNDIYSAYGEGMTNIICNDEIEPVIEIVKETKETVQSENDKAISALLERVSELEQLVASIQSTAVEEGA